MVDQEKRMNPHALAPLVAAALTERTGEVWQVQTTKPDAYQAVLVADGDHATITLEPACEVGRLLMVGSFWIDGDDWREDRADRDHEHRRSTSGSRTPAQIAAAIVAHLLPPYRAELAEVRERRTKRLAGRQWEEQTARELAAAAMGGYT